MAKPNSIRGTKQLCVDAHDFDRSVCPANLGFRRGLCRSQGSDRESQREAVVRSRKQISPAPLEMSLRAASRFDYSAR